MKTRHIAVIGSAMLVGGLLAALFRPSPPIGREAQSDASDEPLALAPMPGKSGGGSAAAPPGKLVEDASPDPVPSGRVHPAVPRDRVGRSRSGPDAPAPWDALPVLRAPFEQIAPIREQFAGEYHGATHQLMMRECFNDAYSTGPPRSARLVLNVEASRESVYIADAIIEEAEGITAELAECFVRTHRRMFLDVRGASPGRFRVEWPILY